MNTINRIMETHPLTWRLRNDHEPVWIKEYKEKHGYLGAKIALKNQPNEIIQLIKDSGLKGRGGAGFPTGLKWSLIPNNPKIHTKYLICNADEMEPGTYKDRLLMEKLPHLLIEGMLIASYAIQANNGYIFLRGEYIEAAIHLQKAISEAKKNNLLGQNILNSNFNFNLILHTGAGRYICGEETALLNSLEGYRAIPRNKPPFPANSGLWGKPTCINNVETLCNIPAIVEHGIKWYKNLSLKLSNDSGTKLMGFSGKVKNPGVWELPLGITAREILEDYAQGMKNNYTLKAWQPGGAGTEFLMPEHLDTPMDSVHIRNIGSRLGTALSIAIDHKTNMVSLTKNLEKFFSRESCGWCTPCRDGLPWIVKILKSLEKKEGKKEDIKILKNLCYFIKPGTTFCAHAPSAIGPLKSAMQYFKIEFEEGIKKIIK
ncbi:NADH-quinone oxidoreductase subunit F [Candidatus Westeberhardia cardiocondylae]|uniref:NADH-quinone oxidoreductase subunit F n=1 Tax=Candidatus Westeberhardia cardiocondylae TaxID=1594731 RepID=A0A0H5BX52_9ENTR|nr:NADH-quinone oxidoreductase subunit NuoF [Candidatus Westeberhardia cardiocondylae]MCR3756216.1 NADH:quinone oxidoreductase subunit F [Candidatus Westeberhardia cardiocondylae]CEN32322.1 NADH-quinone oxidoreductase subunit F [Candidatus Westeberhardia cardiocondylae]